MHFLVYAYPFGGGGSLPAPIVAMIVVVLVLVLIARLAHDRRTKADRNQPGEATLDRLDRRHVTGLRYLMLIATIVVLVILIANAHTPCTRVIESPHAPIVCK